MATSAAEDIDKPLAIEEDDDQFLVNIGGKQQLITKAGMTDDEWEDVKENAREKGIMSTAKAEKLKDEDEADALTKLGKDYLTIEINGKQVNVPRGDMSEGDWEETVKKAKESGVLRSSTRFGGEPEVEAGEAQVRKSDRRNEARGERGGGFYSNMQKVVGSQTRVAVPEARDDAFERSQASLTEAGDAAQLPDLPASEVVKRAGPGRVAKEDYLEQVKKGIADVVSNVGNLNDNLKQTLMETLQDSAHNVLSATGTRKLDGSDVVPASAGTQTVMKNLGNDVVQGVENAGAALAHGVQAMDNMMAARNGQVPQGPYAPGGQPNPGAAPMTTAVNPAQTPLAPPGGPGAPPPGGMGGGMSRSLSVAGNAGPPPNLPSTDRADLERQMREGAEMQKMGIQTQADLKMEELNQQGRVLDHKIREEQRINQRETQRREMIDKEVQHVINTYHGTLQKLEQQDFRIDPARYWNNIDAGRKILWVLAGIFSKGKSNENLGQMIEDDISAQKEQIAKKQEGLKSTLTGQMNMLNMFRQQGLDSYEAEKFARATLNEGVKAMADQLAAQYGTQEAQAKAQQLKGEIDMKTAKELEDVRQHRIAEAQKNAQIQLDQQELKFRQAEAYRARQGGGGDKKRDKVNPGTMAELVNARQGLEDIKQMRKILGPEQGFGAALYDEATKRIPIVKTDAKAKQKELDPLERAMIKKIDGSAIQSHDQEFWKNKITKVGLSNMNQADLEGLEQLFTDHYNTTLEVAKNIGQDTGDLQPLPSRKKQEQQGRYGKVVK